MIVENKRGYSVRLIISQRSDKIALSLNCEVKMATYFAFSDEAGEYKENASIKFCNKYPYYVRSIVLLDATSWMLLKDDFSRLKSEYNLPINKEIKWSYLWSLRKHRKNKENIPRSKPYYFLRSSHKKVR